MMYAKALTASLVFLFAAAVHAAPVHGTQSVWLADAADGDNTITIPVGGTGMIQVWIEYTAPIDGVQRRNVAGRAMLDHQAAFGQDFEVIGFGGPGPADQYGPWGELPRPLYFYSRCILDEQPFDGVPDVTGPGNLSYDGNIYDSLPPYDGDAGLLPNLGAILLDEIIIEGTSISAQANRVRFSIFHPVPQWYESVFYMGEWRLDDFATVQGVGADSNPLLVNVIPEPASLSLLVLGTLMMSRCRR